jgi:hypothetical protein
MCSFAQKIDTANINVELLKAPTSPAFNLLDIAPSDIERPTDITAFMASIQNGTSNFTAFPKNYSVELAPFLLFKNTGHPLNTYDSSNWWKYVLPQSFQLSLGVSRQNLNGEVSDEEGSFTRGAVGIKFSIIRQQWSRETKENFKSLVDAQRTLLNEIEGEHLNERIDSLESVKIILEGQLQIINNQMPSGPEKERLLRELNPKLAEVVSKLNDERNLLMTQLESYQVVKQLGSTFEITRQDGAFLDIASGLVLDFPEDRFNASLVSKAGVWVTGGYDASSKSISIMGIARYLYQPDKVFATDSIQLNTENISTFDFGAKVSIIAMERRFTASAEGIYRSVLNENVIEPSWRLILNLGYAIGLNQKITFAFGKNFDGTITKGGNLVAALNFIKGFGSKKSLRE